MKKYVSGIIFCVAVATVGIYYFADLFKVISINTLQKITLLILGCMFFWIWGVLKSKNEGNNRAMKICLWIYLVLFLSFFASLTLFDASRGRNGGLIIWNKELLKDYFENYLNLIPFRTLIGFFTKNRAIPSIIINIVGNIICLMPLGVLLPLISKKEESCKAFLITVSAVVITVELLQFVTFAGYCDIDDYILNVGGAFLMYLITKNPKTKRMLRYLFLLEKGEEK